MRHKCRWVLFNRGCPLDPEQDLPNKRMVLKCGVKTVDDLCPNYEIPREEKKGEKGLRWKNESQSPVIYRTQEEMRKIYRHAVLWAELLNDDPRPRNYSIAFMAQQNRLFERRNWAIWRLYRYCNETPYWISAGTGLKEIQVRNIIGRCFKHLCLTDKKCVFKPLFQEVQKE